MSDLFENFANRGVAAQKAVDKVIEATRNPPTAKMMADASRELGEMERGGHHADTRLTPRQAFHVIEQLQMALRHPHNDGPSSDTNRWYIDHLQGYFKHSPAVLAVIASGWEEPK